MSMIGAMIGKEGILAFYDTRMMLDNHPITEGYEDGIEKIEPLPSKQGAYLLFAGVVDILETLKPLIIIKKFHPSSEINSIEVACNKKYRELVGFGEDSKDLPHKYLEEAHAQFIAIGFDANKNPKIFRFNNHPFGFVGCDKTAQGFYVFSPIDESEKELKKMYEEALSFDELEKIAKRLYGYTTHRTDFVGGKLKTKRLKNP